MFLTTYVTTRSKPDDDNPAYAQLALPSFLPRTILIYRQSSGLIVSQRCLIVARRKPIYSVRSLRDGVRYPRRHSHLYQAETRLNKPNDDLVF